MLILPFHEDFTDIVPAFQKLDVQGAFTYNRMIRRILTIYRPKGVFFM